MGESGIFITRMFVTSGHKSAYVVVVIGGILK